MTTLTVELPDEQMQVLERAAAQRGLSVPALMSDLAEQYAASQSVTPNSKSLQDYARTVSAKEAQNKDRLADGAVAQRRKRVLQGYGKFSGHGPTIEQRRQWKDEEIAQEDRRTG